MTVVNSINAVYTNIDAFGNLATTSITPVLQLQFPYNINTDLATTSVTGSGSVTHSVPFAVCSTTATTSSSAALRSKDSLHYGPGQGGLCMFTAIFTLGRADSVQEIGLGDETNALLFTYNGSSFAINRRSNGSDNYINQSSWNVDIMDGTGPSRMVLDPTKGNVYKIQYQWLGFGAINFFIENQATGKFQLVHTIKYTNQYTTTTILNPSMPYRMYVANTSNNTNIVLKSGSCGLFVEGNRTDNNIINSIYNSKSSITTRLNIIDIKVNTTFNSITNRKTVKLRKICIANTSNSNGIFYLTLNPTLGGSPSYTDINTNTSVVSYDTAGTTISNGKEILTVYLNGNTQEIVDLDSLNFFLNPGDILSINSASLGSAITASASFTWNEDF